MKKSKTRTKTEVEVNFLFLKFKRTIVTTTEETSKKQAKENKRLKLIRSIAWKIFEFIIKQMIATIISAKVNGLFYQPLILKKNEFFYKEKVS